MSISQIERCSLQKRRKPSQDQPFINHERKQLSFGIDGFRNKDWAILEQLHVFFKIFVLPTSRSQADKYPALHETILNFIGIIGQLRETRREGENLAIIPLCSCMCHHRDGQEMRECEKCEKCEKYEKCEKCETRDANPLSL